jgi:anthranilate/para-aminobenzoate synthase component I
MGKDGLQKASELRSLLISPGSSRRTPFQGGAAGMLSYDFVRYFEALPDTAVDDLDVPDAHFFMFDRVIAFDHLKKRCWVIVSPGVRDTVLGYTGISRSKAETEDEAGRHLERIAEAVKMSRPPVFHPSAQRTSPGIVHQTGKEQYSMVRRVKVVAAGYFFSKPSLRLGYR